MIRNCGHSYASDYWALGVLVYELLVGETPFTAGSTQDIFSRALSGGFFARGHLRSAALDLIRQLLQVGRWVRG